MKLIPVDSANETHLKVLYDLLAERTPEQSISHKRMPAWEDHCEFVKRMAPGHGDLYERYAIWDLIEDDERVVGALYLTQRSEIGIGIFACDQRKGHATAAIMLLIEQCMGGPLYANINPANEASRRMFEKLGFKTIQHTLALETGERLVIPTKKITVAEALKRWPRAD